MEPVALCASNGTTPEEARKNKISLNTKTPYTPQFSRLQVSEESGIDWDHTTARLRPSKEQNQATPVRRCIRLACGSILSPSGSFGSARRGNDERPSGHRGHLL